MSWQTYVDTNLLGSGHVKRAAIHSLDGSCWATSAGFAVTQQEVLDLVKCIKECRVASSCVAGTKYMMLRIIPDTNTAYLKLKDKGGFCVCLTTQAIVFGGYDEAAGGAGLCNITVENLSQYLKDNNF